MFKILLLAESLVNEYQFNYYYDGFYSKLTEVEEYGQNGERYNSTIVDWGDYYGTFSRYKNEYYASLSDNKEGTYPVYADFNGDGKTDFISYVNKTSYTSADVATLYLATTSYGNISFSKNCTIPLISGFKKFHTGDFNGDGNMDVVQEYTQNNKFYYSFYTYNGSLFIKGNTIETGTNGIVQTADYNGDGKDEIFFLSSSHYATIYDLNKTLITSYSFPKNYGNATSCENEIVDFLKNYRLDINGNGKADILVNRTYMCDDYYISMCDPCTKASRMWVEVYELNGNNNFVKIVDQNAPNSLFDGIPGDFNGDGKQDLLCRYDSAQTAIVDIYFSTGTSFEKKRFYNLGMTSGNPIVSVNDFNNDGKSDFVYFKDNGNNQHSTIIYTSTGENFISGSYSSTVLIPSEVIQDTKKVSIGDFDGDGRNELIYSKWNYQCYIQTFNDKQNLLVKKIIDGLNRQISFEYKPITDNGYYMEPVSSYSFPVSKFRQPLYVTTYMNKNDGNLYSENGFFYKNARVHRQGKGFLGFEEIRTVSNPQARETITQYGYNSTYYNTYPVKQTVTTILGDSISRTNYVSDYYTTSPAKVIFPYLKSQATVDKLTGLISKTEYNYLSTNHGNPEKITETRGNLITETANTWEAKNSTFKNRITQQTVTRKGTGTTFIETKKFAYDSKARLTQQIDYFGHPKAVTTNYTNHDSFGNPRTATTTATNCPTITISSTFDETGRFETMHTDALGSSSAVYNPRTGTLTEKTDIASLKTYYSYDGFQKLKQETPPTDNIYYSTDWDNSGSNVYKTTVNSQISGTQTTWYNAAGLEIKTQLQGFSGAVVSGKQYNAKGQLYRSYLPGYGSMSSQYIEYLYDKYGRLQSENNIGRTTSYSYNDLTTTITRPDGTTQSSTLNTAGLTQSSTDAAGNSVVYSYNSLGKPETITSNGLATHIRYDDRGFQRVLKDANFADSIRYEYNAYGQLASQTNARHQVTSFLYDAAGRITQQTRPENTLTYQYVSSGNGIGQIQYVKKAGQTVRTYAYTPLGQPSSVIERIDNTDYTDSYAYNSNGQMTFRATPSGMQISYQYTNGILTSMRNAENNSLLWQADAINALGLITESTLGNGLKRVTGYDTYHLPNQIALKDGATFIDRVDYSFSSTTGNLTQRNDVTNSKNETFGYDNLNRLTSVALNAAAGNTTSYYPNGNINTKFDVGTYQYANGNHAVSGIANLTSAYSPPERAIANTSYNRAASIIQQGNVVKKLDFQYNTDNQRNKTLYYENNTLKKTMYYVGNYEKEVIQGGSTEEYDYICTPEGLSAIAVKANGSRSLYYVQTDHLGSIRVVTAASKAIQTRYYYDAWGKQTLVAGTGITSRGYTGEEHLTGFGLINLNARLYDPVMGRFLEADPYVSLPDFTQAFNRYSYALNNPLKYTDPNGENPFLILAGFLFAKWFYDGSKANNGQWNPLKWDYSNANFMIGYSSNGNLFSFGNGWNNSYSLAFGYNSGSFSIGYLQDGVPHMTPVKWRRDEFVWDEKLYPTGVIRPHEPNFWERFRDGGIISRFTYEFLDMFWVYGTGAFSEYGASHLAGGSASGTELQDAALGTVLTFSPLSWAKGLSGGSSSAVKTGGNAFTYTKSAANHLTEPVKHGKYAGELARPYMKSPLTIQEIMSTGKGIPDATFKGGYNWRVSGTFRDSQGIWELGINPETNTIYHFLFR